jgi:hypothetical protein
MNRNYLFWDVDPTDWDAVYDEYKPKFDALGVFPPTRVGTPEFQDATGTAYGYFTEMTKNLVDGHFSLAFRASTLLPPITFEARAASRDNFEVYDLFHFMSNWTGESSPSDVPDVNNPNYDFFKGTISKYFNSDDSLDKDHVSVDLKMGFPFKLGVGRISHSDGGFILYYYMGTTFSYMVTHDTFPDLSPTESNNITAARAIIQRFIDDLAEDKLRGIIIDLRGNMGGDGRDHAYLWGRMIEKPLAIAYQRTKAGEGRLDYSPWMPYRVLPVPEGETRLKNTGVPIVALVNKFTTSTAEFSTMAIKAMPNGYVIGERTGGASSYLPSFDTKYNGGSFTGGPFWTTAIMAGFETKFIDGNVYEGKGLPVDEEADPEWGDFFGGVKDNRLEKAIRRIDPAAQ